MDDDDGGILVDPEPPEDPTPRIKYYVDGVEVTVLREQVQYFDKDGKPITESLKDYTRKAVRSNFASLREFLHRWTSADRKEVLLAELSEQGIFLDALEAEVGRNYDPFDLVCHVAFDQPPLTRKERAEQVRKRNYFGKYGEQARRVLNALLDKYADEGIVPVEDMEVLKVQPLNELGTPVEIIEIFGGRAGYLRAVAELEAELYRAA